MDSTTTTTQHDDNASSFGALAATCLSNHLPMLRGRALQALNVSFMKGEKVTADDVAVHLAMTDPGAAVSFCEMVHLPIVHAQASDDNEQHAKIAFKTAPIELGQLKESTTHRDDTFVFKDRNVRLVKDRHGFCLPCSTDMTALLQS